MLTSYELDEIIRLLSADEAIRFFAYDDMTGLIVKAPKGRLTIGIGCNIQDVPLTREEIEYLCKNRVLQVDKVLEALPFYQKLSFLQKYVLINVGYQVSVYKLLKFEKMLAAYEHADWNTARTELLDSEVAREYPQRYARLARILQTNKLG